MKQSISIYLLGLFLFLSCGEDKKEPEKFVRPVKYEEVGYLGGEKIRSLAAQRKPIRLSH